MRSLGVSLQRNLLNTKEKQIGFTHWKAKARSLKTVRCLQRQSRNASGTKNPKQTLLRLRLISPTAAEKKVRRTALPIREGSGQSQKRHLKKREASKSLLLSLVGRVVKSYRPAVAPITRPRVSSST